MVNKGGFGTIREKFQFYDEIENITTLQNNIFKDDIPANILSDLKSENLMSLFENIFESDNSIVYGIFKRDDNSKLINSIKLKTTQTPDYVHKVGVEPVSYLDFKDSNKYREMSIPNYIFYILFIYNSILIREKLYDNLYGGEDIEYSNSKIFNENISFKDIDYEGVVTLSQYDFKDLAKINNDFKRNLVKDQLSESTYLYYLETDIESYYSNIYSHSFERIINHSPFNKDEAIQKYVSILDYYNMKINRNETKGIITGPQSSYISAELLNIFIDQSIHHLIKDKDISYRRYVDDMTFYSNSATDLEGLLKELQIILKKYSLTIKEEKTAINKGFKTRKESDIYSIHEEFPYLDYKEKEKKHYFIDKDFYKFKRYIENCLMVGNYTQVKTLLSLMKNEIKKNKLYFSSDIIILYLNFSLKMGYLHSHLQSRVYKVFEEIIKSTTEEIKAEIKKILLSDSSYVNRMQHDTIGQIWHYHILNKLSNFEEKDTLLKSLYSYYDGKSVKADINPLVLCEFITRSSVRNKKILKYTLNQYKDQINSPEDWENSISYSKWWIVLITLRYKGKLKHRDLDKLFVSENSNYQYDKLGLFEYLFNK